MTCDGVDDRHCEERSDEAIQQPRRLPGLLRAARKDGLVQSLLLIAKAGDGQRQSRRAAPPPSFASRRYAAILATAILSALLAPICVSSLSAFISSCSVSFNRAAAFGMPNCFAQAIRAP